MTETGIHIHHIPELERPLMIIGFDGWGNAMNISKGMAIYLSKKLNGKKFAEIDPDIFYRYDAARPMVQIELGRLQKLTMPNGTFYAVKTDPGERDLVILEADEPNLRWNFFREEILSFCDRLGIDMMITLGSMYDNVLHTDMVVSGIISDKNLIPKFAEKGINLIYYQGPSAIHGILQEKISERGITGISLWCHCPYYLQETVHFGMLAHLGRLLAFLGEFTLQTDELENSWHLLHQKIETMIENKPEIQAVVNELKKARVRGVWEKKQASLKKDEKVINLKDFMDPESQK
ncbi:MAG: PAC2 family protein [Pseudomonadota bacterium]